MNATQPVQEPVEIREAEEESVNIRVTDVSEQDDLEVAENSMTAEQPEYGENREESVRPEYGSSGEKECSIHWILWIATLGTVGAIFYNEKKYKKEEEQLLSGGL